jgi:1-acyl-sn-glycerol-3-phosphate acyltransferase
LNVLKAPGGHWALALFPEGTRSHQEEVLSLKKGVASFASKTGAPVLPLGISKRPDGRFQVVIGKLLTDVKDPDKLQETLHDALIHLVDPNAPKS